MTMIQAFNATPVSFRLAIAGSVMFLGSRYGANLPAAATAANPQQAIAALTGNISTPLKASDFGVEWASEERKQGAITIARKCLEHLPEAQKAEAKHGIPAIFLLAIHAREASCDFTKNALNGQPLSQRTTIVPVGYGPWTGPNAWAQSVDDAVSRGYYEGADWSKPSEWARVAEKFNGLGYQKRGLVSPYVWAGDKRYDSQGGKFVSDGVFNRNHFDQQFGAVPVSVAMLELTGND